ncbi:MAG: hemolysin III family protein [Alphaproteobacteria bacterium]|nr:hemolysin III family protein [Alphaproteobacteria bacterium]
MKATAPDMTAESLGEEIANAVTHGIGAALSIAGLVVMVVLAAINGTAWSVVGVSVYGAALIVLYLSSTLYHGIPHHGAKRVLRVLDHSTIYLLIAGTYTPIALAGFSDGPDWLLLAAIWSLALFGIVMQVARPGRFPRLRITLYVAMGWLAVAWARPLIASLGWDGAGLLLAGGIAYTAGIAFYAWNRLRFNHAIWHLFVLAGSSAHFLAIVFYMLLVHPA